VGYPVFVPESGREVEFHYIRGTREDPYTFIPGSSVDDLEALMKKSFSATAVALLALACLAVIATPAVAQDKPVDMKKLIAEIIGDYDFSFQGESMIIQFTEQDGKLFAAPVGETPEEIKAIEGKPLFFDITVAANGQYYEMQFVRNEKGIIDKCIMTVMGTTVEGMKIIK
jgi:hypothetical protein